MMAVKSLEGHELEVTLRQALFEATTKLGIISLKPKQEEAIAVFVSGHDTFVSLPTGYGKSVIFAVLPLVFDHLRGCKGSIVICISPLTSIMMEQTAKFSRRGIATAFLGEAQTDSEVIRNVLKGNMQLVYVSPEALLHNSVYRSMLLTSPYKDHLVALVVDEAHCIKTWGDKFRIAFSSIGELRSIVPDGVKVMALTATATRTVYKKVVDALSMSDVKVISVSPHRHNLTLLVKPLPSLSEFVSMLSTEIQQMRNKFPKTIIFCQNYENCSQIYGLLEHMLGKNFTEPPGYPNLHRFRLIEMYTRACTTDMREKVLGSFGKENSNLRIVVTTTAFSMGIDCPDVSQVFHYGTPSVPEQYVQEIGRAGRNGQQSKAILFSRTSRNVEISMKMYVENRQECRRKNLYEHFIDFCYEQQLPLCKCCDVCARKCQCEECN